jgi:hypothetical protein
MANRKKSDVPPEDEVPLLDVLLDLYMGGDLDLSIKARKCYLNEDHKRYDIITWMHNDELETQIKMRGMAKQNARVILKK